MNASRLKFSPLGASMLLGVAGLLGATVVPAQQMDPNMQMTMPMPAPKTSVKKSAARKPDKRKTTPAPVKKPVVAHANATHDVRTRTNQPAGHDAAAKTETMPADMSMDNAAMQGMSPKGAKPADQEAMPAGPQSMPGMTMPMPVTQQPREPIPVLTDVDRAAAVPPVGGHAAHDNSIQHYVLFDRLEAWNADKGTALEWEGKAWIGTDLNRVWLRSEGERVDNRTEAADLEVLYGHSIATWWDLVAGVRHDFKPGTSRDFAAIGVMGVAPYKYDVEATAYIGQSGQTSARIQAEYDTLLTGRLILQSLVEANLYGQDDRRRGIGSGLSTLEAGFRLRYEFTRRFAPYVGIVQEHAFGTTADFRRENGKDIDDTRLVAGIRIWF